MDNQHNQHLQNQRPDHTADDWYDVLFQPDCPPTYIYDAATFALLDVNQAAVRQYGYSHDELLQMTLKNIRPVDECPQFTPAAAEAHDRQFRAAGIWRHRKKDGSIAYADVITRPVCHNGKKAILVIARDITEQMKTSKPIQAERADLNAAQGIAHVGSWTRELADNKMNWSDEAFCIYGYGPGTITPDYRIYRAAIHPDDRAAVDQSIQDALAGNHAFDNEHRIALPDGHLRTVREQGEIQCDGSGRPRRILGIVQDVTNQRQAEKAVSQSAFYDEITGLPNRRKFRDELQHALQTAQQHNRHLVVLVIQLERLLEINFTLGQVNGDMLLRQVAPRLREVLPADSPIARIGDVQFATLLTGISAFAAAHTSEHILDALNRPFDIAGLSFAPGAHIGAALFPVHGNDPDTLIRHATVAVFQASRSGKNYLIYSAAQDPYKPQRLSMLGEFRAAVESGQLILYCQPKANIRSGQVMGAEALVRWQHPQYGFISPDEFIPLIEPTELIQPLTEWMLESAISQCHDWRQAGLDLPLAVNLSARNLQEQNLDELICGLLDTWGANTSWLDLEITESSIMADPAASKKVLEHLKHSGFRLFVDDYGTGYSSLSYLMRLPVDAIKIDHSFVMPMLQDRQAAAIVKSSIELAHNLGMKVVAEGTASREIWDALKPLGCDEAQGYFIGAPMPAREFASWLAAGSWKAEQKQTGNEPSVTPDNNPPGTDHTSARRPAPL